MVFFAIKVGSLNQTRRKEILKSRGFPPLLADFFHLQR